MPDFEVNQKFRSFIAVPSRGNKLQILQLDQCWTAAVIFLKDDKMSFLVFDEFVKQQIKKVIDYSKLYIYQTDDILDMMNSQMDVPGTIPEHQVLVPIGRWICYYLVNHLNKGRCHYFQIKADASGKLPDKPTFEYIVKEFDIDKPLLDEHITIDERSVETKIILPMLER